MTIYSVDETGWKEIEQFLSKYYLGQVSKMVVSQYAGMAERQADKGNPATFIIKSWDAKDGQEHQYTVSPVRLDAEEE